MALLAILIEPAPDTVPLMVRILLAVLTMMVDVVPLFNVKFRSVDAVKPEYDKVPPFKMMSVPAPRLPLAPAALMAEHESVPVSMVVEPV